MDHGIDLSLDRDLDRPVPDRVHITLALIELASRVELSGELTKAEVGIGEVNESHLSM